MLKQLLIVVQVFALFALAFSPAMGFLVFIAFLTQSTWWFVFLGFPALIVNGLMLWLPPGATLFAAQIQRITRTR